MKQFLIFFALLAIISVAQADNQLNYNVVSLDAVAKKEIPNDLMRVSLRTEHEEAKAALAADKVNKDMNWALKEVKKLKKIKAKTGQYNTHPVYDNRRIRAWKASQDLILESDDFELLSDTLKVLQTKMQISNMQFLPKQSTQDAVEDELTQSALEAFTKRAKLITKSMNQADYDVVDINVSRQGNYQPVMYNQRYRAKNAMAEMALDSAPAVSAGDSTLSVSVRGRIQLK